MVQRETRQPTSSMGIHLFVVLMLLVIAIQGTYLGYVVGVLTTLEKRFGISSEKTGLLLSSYDLGHTIAILVVGCFGAKSHLPRITGIGVIFSSLSMFLLVLPALFFSLDHEGDIAIREERYVRDFRCDAYREVNNDIDCSFERQEHTWAFILLAVGQFAAGVFAAPFNTLAYVYIDNNVPNRRQSPLFLGLLTSMYAFGPALGFGLSAGATRIYTTLGSPPHTISINSPEWIGAWWLGFLLCGVLYLFCALPFFFFPKSFKSGNREVELRLLKQPHLPPAEITGDDLSAWENLLTNCREFPAILFDLCRNSVFVSMVIGWTFGSYLVGGYSTYLPKYIETQYGRSASAADFYAGMVSVGSVAVSTAIGGWLLTVFDIGPRKGILLLLFSWIVIAGTYIGGAFIGCEQSKINGLEYSENINQWRFFDAYSGSCDSQCNCGHVPYFDPVNFDGSTFYSACHAGCTEYDLRHDRWSNCQCAMWSSVEPGLAESSCPQFFGYLGLVFGGLFAGNLFFMVTMMIVLRAVYDDQKVVALSFASFFTNLFGFIPAPILLGYVIDSSCILWHSKCPGDQGNCVMYDNNELRVSFHLTNAGLQIIAIFAVFLCYLFAKRMKFPEEEDDQYEYEVEQVAK